MKHTKGEWKAELGSVQTNSRMIANCIGNGVSLTEEDMANAKLIAAAPELLEALIECSAFLNTVQSPATSARNLKREIDNAINKATL